MGNSAEDYRNIDIPNKPQTVSVEFERVKVIDSFPDLSCLDQSYEDETPENREKYRDQDAKRLAAFERGEWHMCGVYAMCTVHVPIGGNSFQIFRMKSAGLWGVESDSDPSYFDEVWTQEENSLRAALRLMAEPFSKV